MKRKQGEPYLRYLLRRYKETQETNRKLKGKWLERGHAYDYTKLPQTNPMGNFTRKRKEKRDTKRRMTRLSRRINRT